MVMRYDVPLAYGLGFQDYGSTIARGIFELHDYILFYIIIIIIVVIWLLISFIIYFRTSRDGIRRHLIDKSSTHGILIELIWTIVPAIILLLIALPSFRLLYVMDEVIDPNISIKAIGRQWYWTYEYGDYNNNITYDSYLVPESDLLLGQYRLLDVDNPLVLPIDSHIRLLSTSTDVIHSFGVPALGLKVDAIPGRLNGVSLYIYRSGTFYGQCSELCGVAHSAMPIVINSISITDYLLWLNETHDTSL